MKWRLVVHGCVDGFSRVPMYISCETNNRAATVCFLFRQAVQTWGLPSRTRCDQGSENVDVVQYMLLTRGVGRGSALVGRSVHNQRIERLWHDVFKDVLSVFYELFTMMEEVGMLDPLSEVDIWCLHFSFLQQINHCLQLLVNSSINHPLSSERNKTPLQLWIEGRLSLSPDAEDPCNIPNDYGVDWDGPFPDEEEGTIQIPDTPQPITNEQLDQFNNNNHRLLSSKNTEDKVRFYRIIRDYVSAIIRQNEMNE